MRKLLYFLILVVCLGAGLGVGYLRRHRGTTDGGITIGDARPVGTVDVPAVPAAGGAGMTGGSSDAAATSTPATASTQVAVVAATPTTDTDIGGGRGFATGANADPVKSSSGSSTSRTHRSSGSSASGSGSSGGDGFSSSGGFSSGASGSGSGSSGSSNTTTVSSGRGNEVFDSGSTAPAPTRTPKGKKGKGADTTVASGSTDSLDSLPTIDEGGKPAPAATAAPANEDFLNAPTTNTQVAMIPSGGAGDITFPAASGAALKKISQHQAGDKSVVHIERSGDAKYQVFKLKKTDAHPARVWVDFEETQVPGGDPQPVAGEAHIKDISARYIKNSGGGIAKARVEINLSDDKLPTVDVQEQGGGIDLTIGGATIEKF